MKNGKANPPLLTIIVPLTKMAGKLEIVDSWLRLVNWEVTQVIIVHDVQDAITGPELHQINSSFPQLQLIEGTYFSPGTARNIGIDNSLGRYITFWDSDDYPEYEIYIKECEELNASGIDCLIFDFKFENTQGLVKEICHKGSLSFIALNPGIWRWLFRRSTMLNARFPDLKMGEDQVFLAKYLQVSRVIAFSDKLGYKYKQGNSNQLTRNQMALNDLLRSARMTEPLIRKSSHSTFVLILLLRQCVSGIKSGNILVKFNLFLLLLKTLAFHPITGIYFMNKIRVNKFEKA
jgi:glycosyltransferase involved in cell wall biosynthesis